MVRQITTLVTQYAISRNWIDISQYDWCQYALEKQLGTTLFFFICLLLMVVTHKWFEMISFTFVFYCFRMRMGGYHANHVWSCQLISLGLVILFVFVIGSFMECICQPIVIAIDIVVICITYFAKPVYPMEVHFTPAIAVSNIKKKNKLLLGLAVSQIILLMMHGMLFLTYSLLALLITDVSVLFQYFKHQKEG